MNRSFCARSRRARGATAEGVCRGRPDQRCALVSEGKSFFSPDSQPNAVEDYVRQLQDKDIEDSYDLLTLRERELLQLIAEGKSNKEVANMLNLSLYTVETHRSNILNKLNLHSVPELILYAVRKGVIS